MARPRLTTEEWIEKARAVHGDRYDYSETVFNGAQNKLTIICRKHGKFEQVAYSHTKGHNCSKCSGKAKMSTEEWVKKAKATHGDSYTYDKVVYINQKIDVIITCPVHGDFTQNPNNHLRGKGCSHCGGRPLWSTESWVKSMVEIRGDEYDYSLVEYVSAHADVKIICRKHGAFNQSPTNHQQGLGCPKCAIESNATSRMGKTASSIIGRFRLKHGDRYNYSAFQYNGGHRKSVIICNTHGKFEQSPLSHLSGVGCPRCPARYDQPTDLYILTNGEQVKVGIALDPESRIKRIHREQPFTAELVTSWTLADHPQARQVESEVHRRLAELNAGLTGFDGATEWFNTTPAHAAETIKQVMNEMGL